MPMNPKDENEVIGSGKPKKVIAHGNAELVKEIGRASCRERVSPYV